MPRQANNRKQSISQDQEDVTRALTSTPAEAFF